MIGQRLLPLALVLYILVDARALVLKADTRRHPSPLASIEQFGSAHEGSVEILRAQATDGLPILASWMMLRLVALFKDQAERPHRMVQNQGRGAAWPIIRLALKSSNRD